MGRCEIEFFEMLSEVRVTSWEMRSSIEASYDQNVKKIKIQQVAKETKGEME